MKKSVRHFGLDRWLQNRFHEKVMKIPLDAGFSCPNRDGTLSAKGCIFCNAAGSGPGRTGASLAMQWEEWRRRFSLSPRTKNTKLFLAYLQSFTNTYGSVERIGAVLKELETLPDICGACVGTRPDCMDEEKAALFASVPWKEFWLELGVQSCHDRTLKRINRCHDRAASERAIFLAKQFGVHTCAHLMAGLPGESEEDFLETVEWIASLPVDGVKIHNLYVPQGTMLEKEWLDGAYHPLKMDDYALLVAKALRLLSYHTVVHRLAADPAPQELRAPDWAYDKGIVLLKISKIMEYNDWWQGMLNDAPQRNPYEKDDSPL